MTVYIRKCIQTHTVRSQSAQSFSLQEGETYLTSRSTKGKLMVFSRYWVWVPTNIFGRPKRKYH